MYHIYVFPDELSNIVQCIFTGTLNKHLVGFILSPTMNHMLFILSSNRYFIGSDMYFIVFHKINQLFHAACHMELDIHLVLTCECTNAFTWTANEGTNPDNYEVSVTYGRLKVTVASEYAGAGYEVVHGPSGDVVRITHLDAVQGEDVALPSSFGGLSVAVIAAGALSGSNVTGVRVPSGVTVEGALFNGIQSISNVSFAAGSSVTGTLSFCGCASLREVVMPAQALLAPHAFLGCWALERVVFAGEPPFGNNTDATAEAALLTASVRPATLLQMADMICYPATCAAKWEKSLRNFGYGGMYGAYAGEWTGLDSLIADSGNLGKPVQTVVTNEIVTVVSNVIVTVGDCHGRHQHVAPCRPCGAAVGAVRGAGGRCERNRDVRRGRLGHGRPARGHDVGQEHGYARRHAGGERHV